jgi:hypothetical protein
MREEIEGSAQADPVILACFAGKVEGSTRRSLSYPPNRSAPVADTSAHPPHPLPSEHGRMRAASEHRYCQMAPCYYGPPTERKGG